MSMCIFRFERMFGPDHKLGHYADTEYIPCSIVCNY